MGGLTALLSDDEETSSLAEIRRANLRADVAVMRELGVSGWGDITLGLAPEAAPAAPRERRPLTKEEVAARALAARRARYKLELGYTPDDKTLEGLP